MHHIQTHKTQINHSKLLTVFTTAGMGAGQPVLLLQSGGDVSKSADMTSYIKKNTTLARDKTNNK